MTGLHSLQNLHNLSFLKSFKIWANRLIAGTQVWDSVPDYRRSGVKTELASRVEDGEITAEKYKEITGEEYAAKTAAPSEQP